MVQDERTTLKVDPPAGDAAPRRALWPRLLGALLALAALLCGFELLSSLGGLASDNRYAMLAAGLGGSLLLPLLLGWRLRRRGGQRRRHPGGLLAVTLWNLLLLAGLGFALPDACRRAQQEHGSWWVAALVGEPADRTRAEPRSAILRASRRVFGALVELLPGASPPAANHTPSGAGATDSGIPGAAAADAGLPSADSLAAGAGPGDAAPSPGAPVRVTFQRRGASVIVPVTLHGPTAKLEAKMIFDTGATLTTIDRQTVERLALVVDPRDPTIETRTANGTARRILKVVDGIDLADARVRGGLAVTVCEPCADGGAVGLLGLNFQRHFHISLDHEGGQLELKPRPERLTHLYDIRPFVELQGGRGVRRGPQMTIQLTLQNRAPRALRDVRVAAVVERGGKEAGRIWNELATVPPRASVPVTLKGLLPEGSGNTFRLELERADW